MRTPFHLCLASAALCLSLLAGCEATVSTHGTPMTRIEEAQITPGIDTRGSVIRQLGRPTNTGLIDGERWYYVSTVMEQETYHAARIVDRQVVAVAFDETGVVTAVNRFGMEDGVPVALRAETTPTFGRELTIAQQLFGNIGRVNPGEAINR
jgi:outer membrane protein assembly factor BamE (lipoprotein component of BamABCDE complex)